MKMRLNLEISVDVECADYLEKEFRKQIVDENSELSKTVGKAAADSAVSILRKMENNFLREKLGLKRL